MRILFITSNRIGDGVLSTGLLAGLMERYPEAKFWVACGPLAAPLFRHAPRVEKIIELRKAPWAGHWRKLLGATLFHRFEAVVDLRGSATAFFLWTRKRHVLRSNHTLHRVIHNASVAGFDPAPWPRVWPGEAARARAKELIPDGRRVVAIGPSAAWPRKMWPVVRHAELLPRLIGKGGPLEGADVLIALAPGERELARPVIDIIPDANRIELVGEDLNLVAACFERVALYIGNDSGLMHLSAASGAPTLGLFGPTPDGRYDPWGTNTAQVRGPKSREEILEDLGTDWHGENAMQDLTVDMVYDAAVALLARSETENTPRTEKVPA
ncbi:MAG: glycosyltransferase family 9 protein [Parvibaculum sp.]|nr:glycosyltransferase family 9 protein [Parvibaculum sp.]|tara:strand:+ start:4034 stop:5011 length:978 start_codon:yes stop_codon:yes gene_type:complete